jgi:hypothetical protein
MKNTLFWHFFQFLYEKNCRNTYYFMGKCRFGIFFQSLMKKIAKTAFFHIILWENTALAFFFQSLYEKNC